MADQTSTTRRDTADHGPVYEPPTLTELGSLHELTLQQNKKYGESDGYLFLGQPITNASP